jgi:hypothetical protein
MFPLALPFVILGAVIFGEAFTAPGDQTFQAVVGAFLFGGGVGWIWVTSRHL